MPQYVLDTNVVSALMSRQAPVIARLEQVSQAAVSVPVVVWAEIAFGIERLPAGREKTLLRQRFDLVKSELALAPWTEEVTEVFGRLKASLERRGQRIEDFDIAIAAHAIAQGVSLVSANTKHMARIPGIRLEDWSP